MILPSNISKILQIVNLLRALDCSLFDNHLSWRPLNLETVGRVGSKKEPSYWSQLLLEAQHLGLHTWSRV